MAIYIKNEETCRLARELAALMGVTIERAVYIAVKERLERLEARSGSGIAPKAGAAIADASDPTRA